MRLLAYKDNNMQTADLVVIGSGPGGYVACLRAAQLGMSVICVEKRKTLGGTCLNIGCIPSKALLHSSHLFHLTSMGHEYGWECAGIKLSLKKMMARKERIVQKNTAGIDYLFTANKIKTVFGHGFFDTNSLTSDNHRITSVTAHNGKVTQIKSRHVIIATGSISRELPTLATLDHKVICDSEDALSFEEVPKKMVVVGGGVIGLELGSVWSRLGTEVVVIESQPHLLGTMDTALSKFILKTLTKADLKFHLSTAITGIETSTNGATISFSGAGGNEKITCDKVLMSVGRVPNTHKLGLENLGKILDDHGRVIIDDSFATPAQGIHAIGDVTRGPMLAHKAEQEGVAAAELLAGEPGYVNYHTIPNVVYTWPELASVGFTEQELKQQKIPHVSSLFYLRGNARSKVWGEDSGFVKMYAHKDTDEILGAHIAGPHASELIAEIGVAMNFKATAEDIARTCHAHPSVSEAIKESALDCMGRSLHS